jgi:hypothetical protein
MIQVGPDQVIETPKKYTSLGTGLPVGCGSRGGNNLVFRLGELSDELGHCVKTVEIAQGHGTIVCCSRARLVL